jgi:hypothetical protein
MKAQKIAPELILKPDWMELQLSPAQALKAVKPFWLWVVGLTLAAFIIGYGAGPFLNRKAIEYQMQLAVPPLPGVEPLVMKNVPMDEARRINTAQPLTRAAIPAAAPFFFFGSDADRERATDCLAATVYYEAGNEAIEGQMAVVQVVLNRMRHPAYPKTICGVVFQGHERRTGCQFSYTCDGSMQRRRPPAETWGRFRGLARAMMTGMVYAPVGLATHYHTDWVLPYWSSKLDKIRVERTHLFFRYHGYWGSPKAFGGKHKGVEPSHIKLAGLSLVHRAKSADEPVIDALATTEAPAELLETELTEQTLPPTDTLQDTATQVVTAKKDVFVITVDPLLEADALTRIAAEKCGDLKNCKVLAWADEGLLPKGLPINPQERAAMVFSYLRKNNANRSVWNCRYYTRDRPAQCLPGTAG